VKSDVTVLWAVAVDLVSCVRGNQLPLVYVFIPPVPPILHKLPFFTRSLFFGGSMGFASTKREEFVLVCTPICANEYALPPHSVFRSRWWAYVSSRMLFIYVSLLIAPTRATFLHKVLRPNPFFIATSREIVVSPLTRSTTTVQSTSTSGSTSLVLVTNEVQPDVDVLCSVIIDLVNGDTTSSLLVVV
jgi:hypothetical protein